MEKNKRMQFYGGTLGACAPLLVFMCLTIVIAAMKKVSLVLFCMAGFAGLCVAFLLAKNKKEFEQAVVDRLFMNECANHSAFSLEDFFLAPDAGRVSRFLV